MATIKKGILTRAGQWGVHLRPYGKRFFWKRERRAAVRELYRDSQGFREFNAWLDGEHLRDRERRILS